MQRCAGTSDIDPAHNLKGGYRYGGSRISFMWHAEDYRKNPTEIETVMMYWAQGFMSGANINQWASNGQYRDLQAMTTEAQSRSRGFAMDPTIDVEV